MDGGYLPPPPAYSEQEFDQKVANVAEISLTTPQPDYSDADLWEEFNEEAYERAAAALAALNVSSQGSGSNQVTSSASSQRLSSPQPPSNDKASKASSGGIEPLRVEKKSKLGPTDSTTKPRPSWLAEAECIPPSQTAGSSSTFVDGRDHTVPLQLHNDDEDRSSPPPSFEVEGPSWGNHISEHAAPLHYGEGGSTQASPLVSPQSPETVLPPQSSPLSPLDVQFQTYIPPHHHNPHHNPHIQNTYNQSHGQPPRQSLPVSPVQQVLPETRPISSFSPPTTRFVPSPPPQMNFNPSVAYGTRALGHELPVLQQQPRQQQQQYRQPGPPLTLTFDPKAFYNSAVSAHLSTRDRTTRPYSSVPSQHGLQDMQPPTQSYNQQANINPQWSQGNNALGVYAPNHPMIPSSQPRPLVQPHSTYPNQPSFPTSPYGANNNQWSSPNPHYSGYYQ